RDESPGERTLKSILRRRRPVSVDRSEKCHRIPSPLPQSATSSNSSRSSDRNGRNKKLASAHRSSSFSSPSSSSRRPSSSNRNMFLEKENMIVPAVLRRQGELERTNREREEKERAEREARERARKNERVVRLNYTDSDDDRRASDSELSVSPSQLNPTPSRRIEDLYDLVHPDEKSAMNQGVLVFGGETMSKVYAKEWELRKEGLREIRASLKKMEGNKRAAEDSIQPLINILSRSLRDKLYNVYSEALSLLEYTCTEFIPKNNLHSHTSPLGESVHETIVNKAGDAINDRRSALETTKAVKEILGRDGKVAKTFMNKFIKSKEREGTRAEKGRAKIIQEAAEDHNAPNNEIGLSSLNVARFGAACMKSTDSEVGDTLKDLFLRVYKSPSADQSRLRKFLPSKGTHEAQSSIYKLLYAEMDGHRYTSIKPSLPEPRKRSNSKSSKSVRIREDAKEGTDDVDYDKMCMFCGQTSESFTPSQLDIHYLTDCPMLTSCSHCNEVIEVCEMRHHLNRRLQSQGSLQAVSDLSRTD
ncbi:hypothetical protein PFISCL1PPCAC_28482, partial [Pristionchus fissidentatus]